MKRLLLFLAILSFCLPLKASHLMGGELTATHLGGYDYEVKLTAYRDTLMSVSISAVEQFKVYDASGALLFTQSVDLDSTSGSLLPLFPYGVEENFYTDTLTMPGPGSYRIGWAQCCRNGAIINATNPADHNIFLCCKITVYDPAVAVNSSPVFLNKPVQFMPIATSWTYNPLPFDPDGDSLVWSITNPRTFLSSLLPGYYDPPGDPLDPFLIDPFTGTITWTPTMLGNFVASITVDEYRGGVHIGQIVRDMQLIVVPLLSSPAKFDNLSSLPTNDEGYYFDSVYAGYTYSLSLFASDSDASDQLNMEASGEPLFLPTAAADFSFGPTGVENGIEGNFTWTPDDSAVRNENYFVVFRLDDRTFATDLTIAYRVVNGTPPPSTGLQNVSGGLQANLSPNPSTGLAMLNLELESGGKLAVSLYTVDGQLLQRQLKNFTAGKHGILFNEQLSAGQYYVVIEMGSQRQALPLTVIH